MRKDIYFGQKKIAKILGIPRCTIFEYSKLGIIIPQAKIFIGSKEHRKYSPENLCEILLLKVLIKYGIKIKDTPEILSSITKGKLLDEYKINANKIWIMIKNDYPFPETRTISVIRKKKESVSNFEITGMDNLYTYIINLTPILKKCLEIIEEEEKEEKFTNRLVTFHQKADKKNERYT